MKAAMAAVCLLAMTLTSTAFASGAVDYTCVGYSPKPTKWDPNGKETVVFYFTSAPSAGPGNTAFAKIVSRSGSDVDHANADLNLDTKSCAFTMEPSNEHAAYNVTIKGTCGTKVQQDINGICLFN